MLKQICKSKKFIIENQNSYEVTDFSEKAILFEHIINVHINCSDVLSLFGKKNTWHL